MNRDALAVAVDQRYWPVACNAAAAVFAGQLAYRLQQSLGGVADQSLRSAMLERVALFLAVFAAVVTIASAVGYAVLARTLLDEPNVYTAVGVVGAVLVATGAALLGPLPRWGMLLMVVGVFASPLGAVVAYEEVASPIGGSDDGNDGDDGEDAAADG